MSFEVKQKNSTALAVGFLFAEVVRKDHGIILFYRKTKQRLSFEVKQKNSTALAVGFLFTEVVRKDHGIILLSSQKNRSY
ncbi:hypothetical protein [Kordia sp.]|uniref:hypothetical protein n=1 Tax=Kordia sp. TaxID=1965332 RepID=UPI003D28AB40